MRLVRNSYRFSPDTLTVYVGGTETRTFRIESHNRPVVLTYRTDSKGVIGTLCVLLPVDKNESSDTIIDKREAILEAFGIKGARDLKFLWNRIEGKGADGEVFRIFHDILPHDREDLDRVAESLVTPSEMAQENLGRIWSTEMVDLKGVMCRFYPEVYADMILSSKGFQKTPEQVEEWVNYLSESGTPATPGAGFVYPVSEEELDAEHMRIFGHPRTIAYMGQAHSQSDIAPVRVIGG